MESSNSTIVYPTVPPNEADPRARINVMIDIYNASLSSRLGGKVDRGLFHEIWTAYHLVANYNITHGGQISRPLTDSEKSTQKGNSQMITVPLQGNKYRELDMVYEQNGTIHIVEAKNTKTADHSQMEPNVQLAQKLGGGLVYAIGGKDSQEKALREAYKRLAQSHKQTNNSGNFPPLGIIKIPDKVMDFFYDGKPINLPLIATTRQVGHFNTTTIESEYDHEEYSFSLFK